MPLHADALGRPAGRLELSYDARWLMSYAAGVPDERPELYAVPLAPADPALVAHPLFPVAPEWALITSAQVEGSGLTPDEARRGIHVAHDLLLVHPPVAGQQVVIEGRVVAVGERRAGATLTTELTATALDGTTTGGSTVWRTRMTNLFLGVALVGEAAEATAPWPATPARPAADAPIAAQRSLVRTVDAHVYSECARIWNPIHTDLAAARRAGLAAPILHGTATLARAVTIASQLAGVPLASVRRVAARFGAPVDLGTEIEVRVLGVSDQHVWFDVLNAEGRAAVADGLLGIGAEAAGA